MLNNEYVSKRICQNISRLNPHLTIQMKRIIASIRFDLNTKSCLVGMAFYALTSQNFRLVMRKEMHAALNRIIKNNQYNLTQYKTPFLLDIIFRLERHHNEN